MRRSADHPTFVDMRLREKVSVYRQQAFKQPSAATKRKQSHSYWLDRRRSIHGTFSLDVIFMAAVLRAYLGYLFLVFMLRLVGRRPGKQMTPFEYVLIFFIGGLALTGMVGNEASLTNALLEIAAIALGHYSVAWMRSHSSWLARLIDGTPLILLEDGQWRTETLGHMRIQDDDVMASARDSSIAALEEIDSAVLERNGEISIVQKSD